MKNKFDVNAHIITSEWNQSNVSINNLPTFISTPESNSLNTETTFRNWNIKNAIQGWVDGSIENYELMIKRANEDSSNAGLIGMYNSDYKDKSNIHLRPQIS